MILKVMTNYVKQALRGQWSRCPTRSDLALASVMCARGMVKKTPSNEVKI